MTNDQSIFSLVIILVILIAVFNYLLTMTGYCIGGSRPSDHSGYDPICREITKNHRLSTHCWFFKSWLVIGCKGKSVRLIFKIQNYREDFLGRLLRWNESYGTCKFCRFYYIWSTLAWVQIPRATLGKIGEAKKKKTISNGKSGEEVCTQAR